MGAEKTIIAASLDDQELRSTIDNLVSHYKSSLEQMSNYTNSTVEKLNAKLKEIGAVKTETSNTKGSAKSNKALQNAAITFDDFEKAMKSATSSAVDSQGALVGQLKKAIKDAEKLRDLFAEFSPELRKANFSIEGLKERLKAAKSFSFADVLNMPENSVNAVATKMRMLKTVTAENVTEQQRIRQEYERLKNVQTQFLGENNALIKSNNALARSFNYIRNRLIYALTIGTITSFVKQIYEVRGQYELLERSLGVLTNDMRKGSEIFQELNEMALKSPFTPVELGTAAKQLTAYNFAAEEVVETTRRLADISAALGVPMERLTYNLGQIKAQGVLTARDARDFANAGLAIVPMLAQMYTEQKRFGNELVTTAQVYDMMSKKMVSYKDVMKVITNITNEGGKFFDFQAKQADTLRVKLANLTLAWNNMLNDIGKEQQDVLEKPLVALKYLFENWRSILDIVQKVVVAYGLYKAVAITSVLINQYATLQKVTRAFFALGKAVTSAKNSLIAFRSIAMTNPVGLLASAVAAVAASFWLFGDSVEDATEYTERFGKAGSKVVRDAESLFDSLESMTQGTSNYKKVMGELNGILDEYGLELVKESDGIDEINKKRAVAIDLIKQEALERKHLNDIQQGKDTYESSVKDARERLRTNLSEAITEGFLGIGTVNEEIKKNAPALTNIIADIIENNIDLVADKTGEEYEKGVEKIFAKIQERLKNNKALGLSEKTLNSAWLENNLFRFYKSNIITNVINDLKDAKEAQNQYNKAVNENYEAEKQAAEANTTLKDKVEATNRTLMKSANDTDKLHAAIEQIIKDYSGQNIIDFLVRVNAQVPKWMMDKSVSELSQLAARFGALAQNAQAKGLKGLVIGKDYFSTEDLMKKAAMYGQAVKKKNEDLINRKTENVTNAASDALKKYKSALEAVSIAQNSLNYYSKESTDITEKDRKAKIRYYTDLKKEKENEAKEARRKAREAGVSVEELDKAKNGGKGGSKKDVLGSAISDEIKYISEIQKLYKGYRKEGMNTYEALAKSTSNYEQSLKTVNATLSTFGVKGLTSDNIATMDLKQVRDYYASLLNDVKSSPKAVEAIEKAIKSLDEEINKTHYKTIVDGLNSELSKLKDEYELAVELDADPEMGSAFAQLFDIDPNQLPKNLEDYAKRATEILNRYFKDDKIELPTIDLTDDDLKAYKAILGEDKYKILESYTKDYKSRSKKETQDIVKQTKDLQYKLADTNGKISIEEEKLKDLQVKWQKETNAEKKELLALQIKDQQNAIAKLKESLLQELPAYQKLFGSIADHSARMTRKLAKDYMTILDNAQMDENKNYVITDGDKRVKLTQETYYKEVKRTNNEMRKSQDVISQIGEAFTKGTDDEVDFWHGIELIGGEMQKLGNIAKEIGGFAEMLGADEETSEVINDIGASIDGAAKATQGVAQIAIGDYLGGAANVISGLTQTIRPWLDNSDKKILRQIKDSERAVKDLELAYKSLEQTAEGFYGSTVIGAKEALKANRQLQLEEVKRQLRLEQSRSSKKRDEDRIRELRSQIMDLQHELNKATMEIINDLLGISSHEDFFQSLISDMRKAFQEGEDMMKVFDEKWGEMIDSMVDKQILGQILSQWIKNLEKGAESIVEQYTAESSQRKNELSQRKLDMQTMDAGDLSEYLYDNNREYFNELLRRLGQGEVGDFKNRWERMSYFNKNWDTGLAQKIADLYYADLDAQMAQLDNEIADNSIDATDALIDYYTMKGEEFKEKYGEKLYSWMQKHVKQNADEAQTSALQAGISSITETTANALEAYMNGMSQQVYLQSDLITQIRDAVVAIDSDVQTSTQAQMLLQLQNNYIIMQSMHAMMEGWTTPSGQGIRVELLN